ncbi:MAG: ribose 1,5-bisphosphate isomerase, partial [archaeon]
MAALNETVSAIKSLKIQGASEVRKAAVLAIAQEAEKTNAKGIGEFRGKMRNAIRELYNSRPTEPELRAAMQALLHELAEAHESVAEAKRELKKKCIEYEKDRESALKRIAEIGARKIEPGQTILVHCHSHSVMGILKRAKKAGKKFQVICTESRPLFQGRITARELCEAGIPVTMIVDSAVES